MNLAWKELLYSKKKYILIELILVLLIFMVIFLSGLASGLARAVSSAIDNTDATYFVLSDDSDTILTMSSLTEEQYSEIVSQLGEDNESSPINVQRSAITTSDNQSEKLDITYMAINPDSFLMIDLTEGSKLSDTESENTIILDETFRNQGIVIGDFITDSSSEILLKVVGFTSDEMYGHSAIGVISFSTYEKIRGSANPFYQLSYQGIAIKPQSSVNLTVDKIQVVDKATLISNIPGYSAEQGTINMIIWVLVIVSAAILGVFFYVLTIQKEKQFAVLKAIGLGMGKLTQMIVGQVVILACFGAVLGNALAFGIAGLLPASMPFYLKTSNVLLVSIVFIVISLVCSLISTRKVALVDPMIVIGGNE